MWPENREAGQRTIPPLIGVVTALAVWWIWGSLKAAPTVHDEAAYLLQARLFASGRWVGPSPPLPEFFEQIHVLVTPVVAAKYPPGHALLLAPGVLLGLPGLMPVLLNGVSGAFLVALARRVANGWVALLAWILWITVPIVLRFAPSYFSEVTTTAAWLPAGIVLLGLTRKRKAWRDPRAMLDKRSPRIMTEAASARSAGRGCPQFSRPLAVRSEVRETSYAADLDLRSSSLSQCAKDLASTSALRVSRQKLVS